MSTTPPRPPGESTVAIVALIAAVAAAAAIVYAIGALGGVSGIALAAASAGSSSAVTIACWYRQRKAIAREHAGQTTEGTKVNDKLTELTEAVGRVEIQNAGLREDNRILLAALHLRGPGNDRDAPASTYRPGMDWVAYNAGVRSGRDGADLAQPDSTSYDWTAYNAGILDGRAGGDTIRRQDYAASSTSPFQAISTRS